MVSSRWTGIISLIIGIIFLLTPAGGTKAISMFSGIILTFMGIWMASNALKERYYRKTSLFWFIFAFISIFVGLLLTFQIISISAFSDFLMYITGLLFIIAGLIVVFFAYDAYVTRTLGFIGIIVGLVYFVVGILALEPIFLGVIIGIILIIYSLIIL